LLYIWKSSINTVILQVLWPFLLELVVPEKYTEGAGVICRCLAIIAAKKRDAGTEDFDLDYETQGAVMI